MGPHLFVYTCVCISVEPSTAILNYTSFTFGDVFMHVIDLSVFCLVVLRSNAQINISPRAPTVAQLSSSRA